MRFRVGDKVRLNMLQHRWRSQVYTITEIDAITERIRVNRGVARTWHDADMFELCEERELTISELMENEII